MTLIDYSRKAGRPWSSREGAFHDPDPESFGHMLWTLRDARGWSRNRLALEVGCDPSYLSRAEHGSREAPRRHIVVAIARVLRLPLHEANKLLVAGGHAPHIEDWTELHQTVTDVLADEGIPDDDKRGFCELVGRMADQYRRAR